MNKIIGIFGIYKLEFATITNMKIQVFLSLFTVHLSPFTVHSQFSIFNSQFNLFFSFSLCKKIHLAISPSHSFTISPSRYLTLSPFRSIHSQFSILNSQFILFPSLLNTSLFQKASQLIHRFIHFAHKNHCCNHKGLISCFLVSMQTIPFKHGFCHFPICTTYITDICR